MKLSDVQVARDRLEGIARLTSMLYSYTFSARAHGEIYLKAECTQRTGSFKFRGAYNKVCELGDSVEAVTCVSAGNHAQGVALAAKLAGLRAKVVMPEGAPLTKVERAKGYGAEVVLRGRSLEEASAVARQLASDEGLTFIHPFDDPAVIAGQGTIGLEVLEQLPDVATVVVPVGGGGLASGVALAIKETAPQVRVVGVQAEGASAAYQSVRQGSVVEVDEMNTLADGIRVGRPAELTVGLMERYLDDVLLVSDEEITEAMILIMDRSKLVVEPAGAVAVAALVEERLRPAGKVCAILSGGNIDMNLVARVIERGLTRAERYTLLRMRLRDRPGSLTAALAPLDRLKVNVLDVKPHRAGYEVPVGVVDVDLLIETRDRPHADEILRELKAEGFEARRLSSD